MSHANRGEEPVLSGVEWMAREPGSRRSSPSMAQGFPREIAEQTDSWSGPLTAPGMSGRELPTVVGRHRPRHEHILTSRRSLKGRRRHLIPMPMRHAGTAGVARFLVLDAYNGERPCHRQRHGPATTTYRIVWIGMLFRRQPPTWPGFRSGLKNLAT
jgi:hypothetical protein